MQTFSGRIAAFAAVVAFAPAMASAQIAISANDNKLVLVNGVATVVRNPAPDTISIIRFEKGGASKVAEVQVPTSVVGPPQSVAITRDGKMAVVTAAMKIDPADAGKQVPDNKVSVIDLTQSPPKVVQTVEAGAGVAGISFTPDEKLVLAADRAAGTVSVFKVQGMSLTKTDTITLGKADAGVSHVAVAPNGKFALASRDGDNIISVLKIDGDKVEYTKRDMRAGLRPYGLVISPKGNAAFVANIGVGVGDSDTISVIDLTKEPFRVVDTVTVGQTPEGINVSHDGKTVAVVAMNGSNKPTNSPFYNKSGKVILFKVDGLKLTRTGEAAIGTWSQAAAFSADNKTLLVGNMVEKNVQVFRIVKGKPVDTRKAIAVGGGSAAVRTADHLGAGSVMMAGKSRKNGKTGG